MIGTSCTLPGPVLQFPIRRKDEHPFTELDIDAGKKPQDFGAGDFTETRIPSWTDRLSRVALPCHCSALGQKDS